MNTRNWLVVGLAFLVACTPAPAETDPTASLAATFTLAPPARTPTAAPSLTATPVPYSLGVDIEQAAALQQACWATSPNALCMPLPAKPAGPLEALGYSLVRNSYDDYWWDYRFWRAGTSQPPSPEIVHYRFPLAAGSVVYAPLPGTLSLLAQELEPPSSASTFFYRLSGEALYKTPLVSAEVYTPGQELQLGITRCLPYSPHFSTDQLTLLAEDNSEVQAGDAILSVNSDGFCLSIELLQYDATRATFASRRFTLEDLLTNASIPLHLADPTAEAQAAISLAGFTPQPSSTPMSMPTHTMAPTHTPAPAGVPSAACLPGRSFTDGADTALPAHVDIVRVSSLLEDGLLTVELTLRALPDEITINGPELIQTQVEMVWGVLIDTDGNRATGGTFFYENILPSGFEYALQASHSKAGASRAVPTELFFAPRTSLWSITSSSSSGTTPIEVSSSVDVAAGTVSFSSRVPRISAESTLLFYTFYDSEQVFLDIVCP